MANNGVFDLPRQATGSLDAAPTDRLELGASAGTGKLFSVDQAGVVTEYGLGTVPQENIYYVGKHGSDSNTGTSVGAAVLTIGQALTLANGQTPGPSNGFVIYITDGGVYAENPAVGAYITLFGPGAVIMGNVTCAGNAGVIVLLVLATSGVAFTKTTDSGTALFRTSYCRASGSADGIVVDNGELICDIATLNTANGDAITNSGSASHIHGTISKVAVSGSGIGIVSTGASAELSLYISEITGASATGIDINAGEVYLHLGEFSVGTGGDVASGCELRAFVADLYGNTFTGTGDIKVTEAGVSGQSAKTEMHKITSGETAAGYFTLAATPADATSVRVRVVTGPEQVSKQVVGATGVTPDFDVLSSTQLHFNDNGAATGLSEELTTDDVLIVVYQE